MEGELGSIDTVFLSKEDNCSNSVIATETLIVVVGLRCTGIKSKSLQSRKEYWRWRNLPPRAKKLRFLHRASEQQKLWSEYGKYIAQRQLENSSSKDLQTTQRFERIYHTNQHSHSHRHFSNPWHFSIALSQKSVSLNWSRRCGQELVHGN